MRNEGKGHGGRGSVREREREVIPRRWEFYFEIGRAHV